MARICTIKVTASCNQGCSFCHFRDPESGGVPDETIVQTLRTEREEGAHTVRFTGGEPLLDRRLPKLIRLARKLGYSEVELETNGTLLHREEAIQTVRAWGVTRIWLALMHPDGRENDRLTRSPGTAELTWKALSGLKEKIPVGISIAVLKENAEQLPRLVDSIARSNPEVDRLRFNAVTREWTAQWAQAVLEPSLWKACTRARKHKMELRMEGAFAPPPCVFTAEIVQHHVGLYGGYRAQLQNVDGPRVRHSGCTTCGLRERCPGIQPELATGGELNSLDEETIRALRGHLGGEGRSASTQVSHVELLERNPGEFQKVNIRVNWACNQRCRFCWVDFDWTPPTQSRVDAQIHEAREKGHHWIVFTGGEPTLVRWLPESIRVAKAAGFEKIQIQSNGVHFANPTILDRITDAGLTHALISLHGASAEVSDGITQSPGTWEKSVSGIDGLLRKGVEVSLSHVITERNLEDTVAFASFVGSRWKGRVSIVWSVAAPITEAVERYDDGIVSFDRVAEPLFRGLETCLEWGVEFGGQSDTCGVPPCVLRHDPRFVVPVEERHRQSERDFVYAPVCTDCLARDGCRGVRKATLEKYGARGLTPLR